MAFRKTIPLGELRAKRTPEQRDDAGSDYSASRGWWHRQPERPVPGTPKPKKGR